MNNLSGNAINNAQQNSLAASNLTADLQQLLQEWNQTEAEYPNLCIHQLFEAQVERTPDKIAINFEDRQFTYQELNCRANQLAHYLQTRQIGAEVSVGICMQRSPEMVIGLLGILKAGGAYVPLDPAYPQERIAYIIETSQLPVLLTTSDLLAALPSHQAQVVCLDTDQNAIEQQSQENPICTATPDNLAYTIFTSGSTGKPKGVQILHRGVVNFLATMSQAPGLGEQDVLLAVTTICFDIAVLELFLPLSVGARIVLASREVASNPAQLTQLLAQSGATVMQATPATWRLLLASGWQGNPQLKILCGGEAMTRDLADKLLARSASVWNMYGPTETTIWSTIYQVEPENRILIGRAIANTQVYIVDSNMRRQSDPLTLVPVGEPGELLIGGVGLARGYLNRPDLTEQKFVANPFSQEDGSRLYRTGDLARYLPDGSIECLGRIDHQVKIRGFRIELGEIESVLSQHPQMRETAVVAREDVPGDKRLVAYLVVEGSQKPLSLRQLRSDLKDKLPEYMVPSIFVIVDALPLTPNGKVDRRSLPAPDRTNILSEKTSVAPRTPFETQLAQIWEQVLGVEQVGVFDNFFELGGHSILTAQLLSQVREVFEVELPLSSLFQAPTVAQLAEKVAAAQDNAPQEADSISPEDLRADAVLDPAISGGAPLSNYDAPQQIFLTGATGFLGAFLLDELLKQTQATIYCLVRASSLQKAQEKLYQNLKRYLLAGEKLDRRVVPILGDLSQPRLGVTEQQFNQLATDIDVIYHNGAFVNLVYPYSALRAANVLGTQEILKLASQVTVKPVHFISTLDVFQSPSYAKLPIILEQDALADCEGIADGYAQSKWVAEKLVIEAHARGIPTCIYRPSMITGHSRTGASQTNDLVCRLIKGLIQLGSAPALEMDMSLTPVDYVSQAIAQLSQQPASFGQTFHLVSPHTISFRQLVEEIRAVGYAIAETDYSQWQAQLLEAASSEVENALSPLLFLFTEWASDNYLETTALVARPFDCRQTLRGLAGTSITCPPINDKILRAYFSYFIHSNFLEAPTSNTLAKTVAAAYC